MKNIIEIEQDFRVIFLFEEENRLKINFWNCFENEEYYRNWTIFSRYFSVRGKKESREKFLELFQKWRILWIWIEFRFSYFLFYKILAFGSLLWSLKIEAKHVSIWIRLPYYSFFLPVSRFSRFSYPTSLSFSLSLHFFPSPPPPPSSPQFFPFHSACWFSCTVLLGSPLPLPRDKKGERNNKFKAARSDGAIKGYKFSSCFFLFSFQKLSRILFETKVYIRN